MNLVVPLRDHRVAFSVVGGTRDPDAFVKLGRRQFFFVPWRERLLIGTGHYPYTGRPDEFRLEEGDIAGFLSEVNCCWPGDCFARSDVLLVHSGLIPTGNGGEGGAVSFLKRHRIVDHSRHGVPRVVSVVTGKYTTARRAAEDVVDLVVRRLDRKVAPCSTRVEPVPGAPPGSVDELLAEARRRDGRRMDADILEHLVRTYGRRYPQVLQAADSQPDLCVRIHPSAPVIKAQWLYSLQHEAVVRPEDLVWRRTELGARGLASDSVLQRAAELIAETIPGRQGGLRR